MARWHGCGGKFESKAGQHSFVGGATVNAELPKMPESGMYSMRFDLSQIFDPNILKNMKYKLINHSKKIEAEYEFEQQSSARIYSDAVDNVELTLVPGAYLTEIKDSILEQETESLDEDEDEVAGCCCGEEHEHD
jgi:type VI secretion system secreted protein VgrG